MHQIGFIEYITVQAVVLCIFHQNLRGLAQACQQFVCGLGGEHHRFLAARTICANRVVITIKVMESSVRQPCFVEMQGVDLAVQHILDLFDVIQHAIIGGLRNSQHAWFRVFIFGEWVCRDLLLDVFPSEFLFGNRPDDAEMVTCRH